MTYKNRQVWYSQQNRNSVKLSMDDDSSITSVVVLQCTHCLTRTALHRGARNWLDRRGRLSRNGIMDVKARMYFEFPNCDQRSGACRFHNPKVRGLKPRSATYVDRLTKGIVLSGGVWATSV
jgi:hypothetical protein